MGRRCGGPRAYRLVLGVEALIYLDTHVALWLYSGDIELFSRPARLLLASSEELRISPLVLLEMEYLKEIGRLRESSDAVLSALETDIGLTVCDLEFAKVIRYAVKEKWTRDPFDRILVGHAALTGARLVTKDSTIRKHYRKAIW